MNKPTITLLQVNGWVAVLIGSFILLDPVAILNPYGLPVDLSAGLMSELRAPGGLLIACGLIIGLYSLNAEAHAKGLQLSAMVYGGYGSARLLGFILDGQPPMEILVATGIELILFSLSILVMQKYRNTTHLAFTDELKNSKSLQS